MQKIMFISYMNMHNKLMLVKVQSYVYQTSSSKLHAKTMLTCILIF